MRILANQTLKEYNTFQLDIKTKELAIIESDQDLKELSSLYNLKDIKYLVLGEGSNILFTGDFDGLVITSSQDQIKILKENERHTWIEVQAGLNWHSFVIETLNMGLQGLENLSLIPGKTGAAPIQNIGAYGVEIQQFIESVEAFDLVENNRVRFTGKECEFGYRSSIFKTRFKNRFFITSTVLKLNRIPQFTISYGNLKETIDSLGADKLSPKIISDAVIDIRSKKLPDPARTGNAGSFFKNPVIDKTDFEGLRAEFPDIIGYESGENMIKIPAAWLIEKCGLKGIKYKDAGTHPNQPLVIVNYGKATGRDILDLAEKIREKVSGRYGIILEPEVNII